MWSSILQNGRKNRKDDTAEKIKQYTKLNDKSTLSSKFSKSTIGSIRTQTTKKSRDKENSNLSFQNKENRFKGLAMNSGLFSMNPANFRSKLQNENVFDNESKKSVTKVAYEKTTSVLRIKKQDIKNVDGQDTEMDVQSTYFLECMKYRNKIKTQFHTNIHNSIFTFREFLKSCRNAKEKMVNTKIPPETNGTPLITVGRKTIIFDMDETLIHTNESPTSNFQIKVPFRSFQGRISYGYVEVRPYAKEILVKLSQHFDIIIFTASTQAYADPIIDHIDPSRVVQHRLYRESCSLIRNQVFVKDLRVLGRDLSRVVLVDNAPYSYMMQLGNGIPILPFYKGKDDNQLFSLQKYVMMLKDADDVRTVNSKHFKLHQYIKYDNHDKLIKNLYPEWLK